MGVIVYGYDGLPMMPEDPYEYVEAAMQEPPPPDYVPELVYPEFMPPEDDVFPAEEQPLPAAVSPTTDSPGYITESDPEDDPEEEDDKDHREDPANYLIDRDDEEEGESFGDMLKTRRRTRPPMAASTEALIAAVAATFPLPSPLTPLSSPLPQIPSPPFPGSRDLIKDCITTTITFILTTTITTTYRTSTHRASMVMMRATAPSTYCLASPSGTPPLLPIPLPTSSPPFLLPSTDCRADVPKVMSTGGFRADYGFVGTLDAEIRRDPDREVGYGITDVWVDPDEITKEIPATNME
ncbi:hypothetical protein Tco_0696002, partial [Tanacetum coccineum]